MRATLATAEPIILVEVTEAEAAVCALLEAAGYRLFAATLLPRGQGRRTASKFALHRERHKDAIG